MPVLRVENVSKTFVLHHQNGVRLPVLRETSLSVDAGECVVLHGHSGSGKSTLLRSPVCQLFAGRRSYPCEARR